MPGQKLGQHFLADAGWQQRILRELPADKGLWLEIGAGHGEMTRLLSARAGEVLAVELDSRLAAKLRESLPAGGNVRVVESDVLALDIERVTGGRAFSVYGNLPYYITSPILHRLFEHAARIVSIYVVIQLEVAERIAAQPGHREYGYLSVASQWFSRPELIFTIPPGAFHPAPKVASALVRLSMPGARATVAVSSESEFLDFVKLCFSHKRKTLRNNLRGRLGPRAAEILHQAGLPASARAEQLSVAEFAGLFKRLEGFTSHPEPGPGDQGNRS